MQPITIKPYVKSLEGIIRSTPDTVLGSVLSQGSSSHNPVFVFDSSDTFIGLVAPFQVIFASSYPQTTKLASLAVMPPVITTDTPVYQVAKYMLAAKVYILPVTDEEGIITGVVRAVDIMNEMKTNPALLEYVSENIVQHEPISEPITALVKDVFHQLKERGVSRMILTNENGTLAGIVTRGDLLPSMLQPTDKQRFAGEGSVAGQRSVAGEKEYRLEEPVIQYATTTVDSLPVDTLVPEIISHLLNSKHNNVVLVDNEKKPAGFISARDILLALTKLRPESSVNIILKKPSDAVSDEELQDATEYVEQWAQKFESRMEIQKIEIMSQEAKNTAGVTNKFNITLIVTPTSGGSIVADVKDRDYIDGIREATNRVEKQQRRSDR